MRAGCDFHPDPSKPGFQVPPGAVDAHCHVFGPGDRFPYAPERKYTPCDASKDQLWALRDHLGFSRSVIVQATCHGADNRALVDALEERRRAWRAASRRSGRTSAMPELADLRRRQAFAAPASISSGAWSTRCRMMHWNPLPSESRRWAGTPSSTSSRRTSPELYDFFRLAARDVVFDHMGRPDVTLDPDGAAFGLFRRDCSEKTRTSGAKVSCPERLSVTGPPAYDDVVPFAKRDRRDVP